MMIITSVRGYEKKAQHYRLEGNSSLEAIADLSGHWIRDYGK